jgi:tetratricopeptide (TPR) repeat protein
MNRSNRLKLHSFLTALPAALLVALLSGAGVAAHAQDAVPDASALNSALFYEILVGELSAQNGDASSAYALMLDGARKANSPQLFERAVDIALSARAGDSALQAAQAWSKAFPQSREANRYLLQILVGLNKLAETVEPIKREIAAIKPEDRAAAFGVIPRYFARSTDKKLAATVVEQALGPELNSPQNGPAAWSTVGAMRLMAGNQTGALDAAQKGAALNDKATEPVQLALALVDPKLPDAEAMVIRYFKTNSNPELQMSYVRRLLDAGRNAEVADQIRILTSQTPDFPDAWLVRGSLEVQDKKPDAAKASINHFIILLKGNPKLTESAGRERGLVQAYFLLAQIAESGNNLAEAQRYLDAIDSPQDYAGVQTRKAALLAKQGKLDDAIAMIRAIPENQPEDARTKLNSEVQLLRDNKRYQDAYNVLAEAVKDNSDDNDLAYDLAMAAEKIGKVDEMEKLLRQVIAANPQYHNAYNALGYSLADRNVRVPEARQLIAKALEFAPDDPYIVDSMAWVEYRSGNKQEALNLLQSAFKAKPDPEIAAHLGEVLWSLDQKAQAKLVWKKGSDLDPDNETLKETVRRLNKP